MDIRQGTYIIGVGNTRVGKLLDDTFVDLMATALQSSIDDVNRHAPSSLETITKEHIGGLFTCPSIIDDGFMLAHKLSYELGLQPASTRKTFLAKCIDVGGASPISAIIDASRLLSDRTLDIDTSNQIFTVLVGDMAGSIPSSKLSLQKMPGNENGINSSKSVPMLYNLVAKWYCDTFNVSRDYLASVSSLMSQHASHNPQALSKAFVDIAEIKGSIHIDSHTSLRECARRADGAASILVASHEFIRKRPWLRQRSIRIAGRGESSNLIDFNRADSISLNSFCIQEAFRSAVREASEAPSIDMFHFYGIYDCFPVCFIRTIEEIGLAPVGKGAEFMFTKYKQLLRLKDQNISEQEVESRFSQIFPINTHGGLMHFAAPWEIPSAYNVIESVRQLRCEVQQPQRQVHFPPNEKLYALATGNGGVFSSSSIIILEGTTGFPNPRL